MKKIIYIFSAALLCLVACTRENFPMERNSTTVAPKEGDLAVVRFTVSVPETQLRSVETRSLHDLGDQPNVIGNDELYVAVFGGGDNENYGGTLQHFLKANIVDGPIDHNEDGTQTQKIEDGEPVFDENGDPVMVAKYKYVYEVLMPLSNDPLVLQFMVGACDENGILYDLDNPLPTTINNVAAYEKDIMPLLFSKPGKAAYWQRVRIPSVDPLYDADGKPQMTEYIIGYDQDDKPIYSEDQDYKAAPIAALHDLALIRNFARLTFTSESTEFEITGFVLIDTPVKGTVAPWSSTTGYHTAYSIKGKDSADIMNSYVGYVSNSHDLNKPTITDDMDFLDPGVCDYMYERSIPSANPAFDESGALIRVEWKTGELADEKPRYYKISLVDRNGYVPILRNIEYDFQVTGIKTPKHYESPTAAYAGEWLGDISANIVTASLNEIGNSTSKIFVSQTSITKVGDAGKKDFTFKFYPDAHDNNTFFVADGTYEGAAVDITISDPMEVSGYDTAINIHETETGFVKGIKNNGDGTVTVSLLAASSTEKKSKIRVQGKLGGQRALYREIIFTVMEKQEFVNNGTECTAEPAEGATDANNQDVTITIQLPSDLPRDIFPLQIMIEPQNNGLRSVPKEVDGKQVSMIPVQHGESAFDKTKNNYYFVKTITFAEYATLNEDDGTYTYKNAFPCYFKTRLSTGNSTAIKINDLNKEYFEEAMIQLQF